MEIFPASVRDLWNQWELRVLVLLSLTWQVLLIIFGSRRKYARGSFISALVWFTYLSADWLATVSLGNLANSQGAISNTVALQALWAPFLLLHLGGPDTITAYALEDNTLWLRHLLGLLVQVGVAFYVYLRSWSTSPLTFIAIPVFISGLIKYSERTWVLRFASPAQFEDSLISVPTLQDQALDFAPAPNDDSDELEIEFLHTGYLLFPILKPLYANLSLRFAEGRRSHSLIMKKKREGDRVQVQQQSHFAFKVVEVQLGLLYDLLYTKAPVIYSLSGLSFRLFSVFSMLSALVAYLFFINYHNYYSDDLENLDYYVTLVLFVGAILLELYALVSLLFSDLSIHWLSNKSMRLRQSSIINWALIRQRRWAGIVCQHDLLSFCMKRRVATYIGISFLFRICFAIELYWQRTWNPVEDDLKELIFRNLLEKHKTLDNKLFDHNALGELLSFKSNVLGNHNFSKEIKWSVEFEFDHCVLVWHVATGVYYYSTAEEDEGEEGSNKKDRKMSKMLSDYMMYILLMRPFMLPKWIDRVAHVRDTFREAIKILQQGQFHVRNGADAARMLVQTHRRTYQPLKQLGRKSDKSVLVDGCRLGSQLQSLGCSWKMICEVWIEMITYAASQCEWGSHAQQLRRGGELLTHVRLLMAELGLSEQFDTGMQGPPTKSQHENGADHDDV